MKSSTKKQLNAKESYIFIVYLQHNNFIQLFRQEK